MKKIQLTSLSDERGSLVSIESGKTIPWNFKRVYYIYNVNKEPRGFHAHKKLKQLLICLSGSCEVKLDDGTKTAIFHLSSPEEGLFIDEMVWREMYNFSPDCVLMVLADDYYKESDYIRNYENFINLSSARE